MSDKKADVSQPPDAPPAGNDGLRPYTPPKLRVYGDLRQITQGKGGGANDGAPGQNTKLGGS